MRHFEQDELTRQIEAALSPLVGAAQGVLDVADDPEHAYELLSNGPRRWRLVMGWQGWADHEEARTSAVYDQYYFIVQIGSGLQVRPGAQVYRQRPGDTPNMMDLIQRVDAWVRALRFLSGGVDKAGFQTQGGDWLALEGDKKGSRIKQHRLQYRLPRLLPVTSEIGEGLIEVPREPVAQ